MSSKKGINPIGLAMLDLISNALAATVILFICLASLRKPFIPPERVQATLYVRYEIKGMDERQKITSSIFLEPIVDDVMKSKIKFGVGADQEAYFGPVEINLFNFRENQLFGTNNDLDCGEVGAENSRSRRPSPPCATVYSPVDSANVHYLILRDPPGEGVEGEVQWLTGIIYASNDRQPRRHAPVRATINARYVMTDDSGLEGTIDIDTILNGSTGYLPLKFRALRKLDK